MDCPSGNEYKVSVTGFAFGSSLAHAEMPKPPSSGRRWRRRRRRIGASVLSLYFRAYPQGFPNVRCLPFCFLCYSRHCGNSHFGACRTTFLPQRTRGGERFSHHATDAVAGFSDGRRNIYLSPPKAPSARRGRQTSEPKAPSTLLHKGLQPSSSNDSIPHHICRYPSASSTISFSSFFSSFR